MTTPKREALRIADSIRESIHNPEKYDRLRLMAWAGDELRRLDHLMNTPQIVDFLESVKAEAAFQESAGWTQLDEDKQPADWMWLIGWLVAKALHHQYLGDFEKALHHTISSAAVLSKWHQAIKKEYDELTEAEEDQNT